MKLVKPLITASLLALSQPAMSNSSHPVFNTLDVYDFSINQSSVSSLYDENFKREQNEMIQSARDLASEGHYRTAKQVLNRIANNIYGMQQDNNNDQLDYKDATRLQKVLDAASSIYPVAVNIAQDKQSYVQELEQIQQDIVNAEIALENGNPSMAKQQAETAYRHLKSIVSSLRSGDRLVLLLPEPGTRAGWQDAAGRYQDWRFYNNHLVENMISQGQDITRIDAAISRADFFYEQALEFAWNGDWKAASEKIDLAYKELETSWAREGIDIGVL